VPVGFVERGRGIWLTALWFEGRMFSEGEVGGSIDGAICCEVRLEVVLGEAIIGRGEGGTEFRSGAMF
jgi:hypothetical protein